MTNFERETIINFNESESFACVETYSKRLKNRLAKLAEKFPSKVHLHLIDEVGCAVYTVDKTLITIRMPR